MVLVLVRIDTGMWQKRRDRGPEDVAVMSPGWPPWRWGEEVGFWPLGG